VILHCLVTRSDLQSYSAGSALYHRSRRGGAKTGPAPPSAGAKICHKKEPRGSLERGALAPLFVLISARPEFHARLSPLDGHQVRRMVGELAASHALPKEVVDGVTERTGGVPLFVKLLL
jgi:hypothetical protein